MHCRSLASFRKKSIASAVAALCGFALGDAALAATTHYVSSCADDGGAGTLRSIVGDAGTLSGDAVDLSDVAPCTITLDGPLVVDQNELTIRAPAGKPVLLASGGGSLGLVNHGGDGQIAFDYIDFANGNFSSKYTGEGGCISSPGSGSVQVSHGSLSNCSAHARPMSTSFTPIAHGGAICAAGHVTLKHTKITGSVVSIDNVSTPPPYFIPATGGAVYAGAGLDMQYSTVTDNRAYGPDAMCGGVDTHGNLTMRNATISGNTATGSAGGLCAGGSGATYAHIYSSTISGNTADAASGVGGAVLSAPSAVVANTTIAFNGAAGVAGLFLYQTANAKLQSTIVSNNSTPSGDVDFGVGGAVTPTFDPATSNNFVRAPGNSTPPGTTTGSCPNLGALRDNGGATPTHALASDSPAIDAGSNPYNEDTDQRGDAALYPRVSGTGPDAGAYEVNRDDIVFATSFDGC